ncbi:MAG: hypothetical protein KJ808_05910 [Acidobacteria bacterium]|nr:hypothetical protein [Acidobacteriota bacterium]MBU4307048.1 hypothetical protein [Acidobacteriota bacterium]MBU4405788.1 hypothetical protein [Acidobacteriota bacterium]MCG2810253.1 hypothetical protein [Candidatus Aminicenantes bacterium]
MKKFFLFGLFLLVACDSAQTHQKAEETYSKYPWQFTAPMPHGRYGHDAVYASNGKIYVMGGQAFKVAKGFAKDKEFDSWLIKKFNNGRYSNLAYDIKKNEWEFMTSIPGRVNEFIVFFDPNEDKWSERRGSVKFLTEDEKIKMNEPRRIGLKPFKVYGTNLERQGNGVALSLSNRDFILWTGGQSYISDVEDFVLPYFIQSDSWPKATQKEMDGGSWLKTFYDTNIPPMQEPRRNHQAVTTSDGKIYVLGGWRKEKIGVDPIKHTYLKKIDVVSKTMECYDPMTNKWEYKKPLGRVRMVFAAVAGKDDKIYVFGGAAGMSDDRKTPILDTVEVYDPKTDSWSLRKPMPTARFDHAAVLAADGRIYVMGGAEAYDEISSAVLIFDPATDRWEHGPDMILSRAALAAAATPDGKIYAIGGTDVGAYKNKANWQHLTSLVPKDELRGYEGKVLDSVEVLDIYKWKKNNNKRNDKSK